jgi:hypothetical protein
MFRAYALALELVEFVDNPLNTGIHAKSVGNGILVNNNDSIAIVNGGIRGGL